MLKQPSVLLLSFPQRAAEGQTTASGHPQHLVQNCDHLSFKKLSLQALS